MNNDETEGEIMTDSRPCPDCHPRNGGEPCDRCQGNRNIPDLGLCQGIVVDDAPGGDNQEIVCPFPADRMHFATKTLLCDGHALGKALELGEACATCGGNPGRGMHRGEAIGVGKVMTCSGSKLQKDLQDISDVAAKVATVVTERVAEVTETAKKTVDAFGKLGDVLRENLEEGMLDDLLDDMEPDAGESCLTDSERNPSMGAPGDSCYGGL